MSWGPDRPASKLSCEARQVLASCPTAVAELNAWYSGYYMAECAPLDGDFHKACQVIQSTYGDRVDIPCELYRVDRGDLPEGVTTTKPITSWSRSHKAARSFYDVFTHGVNRLGASQYSWRIIRATNPKPIVTFEATLRFLRDTNTELWDWLNCPDMLKSEEVICRTPDKLAGFQVAEAIPLDPLGEAEEHKLVMATLLERLGLVIADTEAA
jgi:hypothetical protein